MESGHRISARDGAGCEADTTMPTLWAQMEMRSETDPHLAAVVSPHRSPVSCRQLWERVEALGGRFDAAGIARGSVVALVLPEGPHLLSTILGVSRWWACAPVNPALTAVELEALLRDLAPVALLVAPEYDVARDTGRRMGLTVLEAHEEEVGREGEWRLLASGGDGGSRYPEIAVILQTSATTGRSKLVGLSRANLQASIASTREALRLTECDRVLLLSPLFHLQGILSALSQLAAGGSAVALCLFHRDEFVWWLDRLRPTWYTCGPTMHRALCSLLEGIAPQAAGLRPHSLRFVRSIGAPLSPELATHLTAVLGAPVLNGYGMTETGVVTSLPTGSALAKADSVGKTTGTEIRVCDPAGHPVAPGQEGEIVLRGPNVMAGYLNDPEANRRSFQDGWFRTGDLGRMDGEGFLYLNGRLKEQINRGGEKIHPTEVDDALASHPAVEAVAAFGVPHPSLGEDVACAVILRPDAPPISAEALRRFAAERLAPFKVPRRILFVSSIPRGATGKPQRHLLGERLQGAREVAHAAASATAAAPTSGSMRSTTEQQILALWCELLHHDELSPDEDFFSAGGDSMGAVAMLSELEQICGLQAVLSTESFFYEPTVAHLAEMVETLREWEQENSPSEKIVVVPVQQGMRAVGPEALPHLYLFPPNANDGTAFRKLAGTLGPEWPVSLVRPGHMRHRLWAYVIEQAATESAQAIRVAQPDGPYLLGGFCFGGLIAYETARLLERQGCRVKLILFDTPAPGYPQFFYKPRHAGEHLALLRDIAAEMRRPGQARAYGLLGLRKVAWNAILLLRPLYSATANWRPVRWIADRAQMEDLPFFRLRSTGVPILHLLGVERPNHLLRGAYAGWRQVARSGVTEIELPGNHITLLSPGNMSRLAEIIRAWAPQVSEQPSDRDEQIPAGSPESTRTFEIAGRWRKR